ncbi:hypothetical protein [Roseibium sp.]|uniref:hypothetical protein n=1 Tax=Roseibium sp. TaxID=1936156 RepID=UPI003D12D70F
MLKKKLDCFAPAFEELLGNGAHSGAVFFCQLAFLKAASRAGFTYPANVLKVLDFPLTNH